MAVYIDTQSRLHHDQQQNLAVTCPHCQVFSHITPLAIPQYDQLAIYRPKQVGIVFRCDSCNAPILLKFNAKMYVASRVELATTFVELERAKEKFSFTYLPEEAELLFKEALACYSAVCFNAFGSMCRRTAQVVFAELGNSRTADTTFAFNVVRSDLASSVFLVTRGADSGYGPVTGTALVRNTVSLRGVDSQGVVCHAGCGPSILRMRDNVVVAGWKAIYADAAFDEDGDLFWGGAVQVPSLGPTTIVADPRFVDAAAGDVRLQAASPAIERSQVGSYSGGSPRGNVRLNSTSARSVSVSNWRCGSTGRSSSARTWAFTSGVRSSARKASWSSSSSRRRRVGRRIR